MKVGSAEGDPAIAGAEEAGDSMIIGITWVDGFIYSTFIIINKVIINSISKVRHAPGRDLIYSSPLMFKLIGRPK